MLEVIVMMNNAFNYLRAKKSCSVQRDIRQLQSESICDVIVTNRKWNGLLSLFVLNYLFILSLFDGYVVLLFSF